MYRPEVEVVVPRHAAECDVSRAKNEKAKQRAMGHCRCPKYLYVRRTRLRISANTRSWERAREEARAYADQHDPKLIAQRVEEEKKPEPVLLSDAIEKFIEARRLVNSSEKTIANLKPDCYQFLEYMNQRNRTQPESDKIFHVDQVTTGLLNEWMATWKGRAKRDRHGQPTTECTLYTKAKKRKHINMLFKHCVDQGWLKVNPAATMLKITKRNQPSAIPKLPFTREQMGKILGAAKAENHAQRGHAFVSTMRRSGLSILDTTTLERSRLLPNDRLELYRTKTGEAVYLLLEPHLAKELRQLPAIEGNDRYFFWHGNGAAAHAANNWGKILRKIFNRAKITLQDRYRNPLQPSSHFFRNTFAKEMLETGDISIDQLAMLLGDSPAIVHEHYHKWVPDLQHALDRAVRASWNQKSAAEAVCPTCGKPLGDSVPRKAAAGQIPERMMSRTAS